MSIAPPPLPQFNFKSDSPFLNTAIPQPDGSKWIDKFSKIMGAVSPAFGLASGIIGSISNKNSAAAQMDFQERMMRQQHQWDLEALVDNRAYNTPKAIMQRMKEAGLNPDLAYGMASGMQNPAMAAQATAPTGARADVGSPLVAGSTAAMNNIAMSAQLRLMDAQTENLKAEARQKGAQTTGVELDNADKQIGLNLRRATQANELSGRIARFQEAEESAKIRAQEAAYALYKNENLAPAERDALVSRTVLNYAEAAFAQAGTRLRGKQLQHFNAQIANLFDSSGNPISWSNNMFSSLNTVIGGTDLVAGYGSILKSINDRIFQFFTNPVKAGRLTWQDLKDWFTKAVEEYKK